MADSCTCQPPETTTVATGDNVTIGEPITAADATPAPVDEPAPTDLPERWHGVLILEDTWTTDGRRFTAGALEARPLPLPLRLMVQDSHGGLPENRVVHAGSIDSITREGNQILGQGRFDLESPDGQEAARLVRDQFMRWVSAEVEPIEYEVNIPMDAGVTETEDAIVIDEASDPEMTITRGNIMGATILSIPAFPQAVIAPEGVDRAAAAQAGEDAAVGLGITEEPAVAAAGGPLVPPAAWFEDPGLDGPTPLTVEDDGRVYGHAALWGTCHTGRTDVCLTAPRSASSYAYFRTGSLQAAVGGEQRSVRVGQITMATGHAPLTARHRAAAAHYDDTGAAVADIATGEDEHGIWVAGALRSDLSDEQLRTLRASSLSGDWRSIGGQLELVALLAVNVPGFPVPAVAAGAARDDGQLSLVAAGVVHVDLVEEKIRSILSAELAPLRAELALLRPQMVAALDERMTTVS